MLGITRKRKADLVCMPGKKASTHGLYLTLTKIVLMLYNQLMPHIETTMMSCSLQIQGIVRVW